MSQSQQGLIFHYPAVAVSLDGERAILVDHLEGERFRDSNTLASYYVQASIQLTPRAKQCRAKILATYPLRDSWDDPGQTVCWNLSFDAAFPGLALLAVGEYLDHNDVPPQPEPAQYSFTAEVTTDVFDVLQRRSARDDDLTRFLRAKIYWGWRFKLPETHIELPDAARLGVSVDDLHHAAYRYEQQLWTRTGPQSFTPTPAFIREMDALSIASAPQALSTPPAEEDYEVALSFAGEQRDYVQAVARALAEAGIRVFYDHFEDLWGVDLTKRLEDVYRLRSRYVVVFVSREYISKSWPNLERQHALSGRIERRDDSVLPARFEDLELPGLPATVGYLDIRDMPPEEFARRIVGKLRRPQG